MTFLSRILDRLGKQDPEQTQQSRTAAPVDHRDSDGEPGTSSDDEFVGRTSGKDEGYLDTGAEHRSAEEDQGARRRD